MENLQETCRTCLAVRIDEELLHMMDTAGFTEPKQTYADVLRDLGKLEV